VIGAQAKAAKALAELLGDDHDLALLDERVRASGAEFDEVLELIARRRNELQDEAFASAGGSTPNHPSTSARGWVAICARPWVRGGRSS
jgi:hypothetical protein